MAGPYGRGGAKKNNIKNEESALFKSLTRLFSGPLVNFRQQSQLRFRRRDLNKFKFNSASGKQFQKTSYNPFDAIQANIMANQTRAERYSDFDQMEFTPEIASALDIYADEMTTHSSLTKILTIKSPNQEIRGILDSLFYDVLNIEFSLFGWCRTMCKFGDMFLYLDIDPELGVKSVLGLPTPEVERLEGEDKTNPNYVQFQWNTGGLTFESWQIAHFRILGQDKYAPYGTSVLESSRRIWRQLNLLEDAMMAYRIVRAPDRRVFYLDVGNIAPEDVEQFMIKAQAQMKRNMIVDQNTGRVDLRYNPMPIHKDTFIPLLDGRNITIETLAREYEQGKQNWVYSVQDDAKQVVPGKVVWCGKNYEASKLIKVWLDNDTYVTTAPEHPFIMRDGSRKRADQLLVGDALMPFYRDVSNKGYERIYNIRTQKYEYTHKLVAHDVYREQVQNTEKATVHHKNFLLGETNKLNNHPDNLEIMSFFEHRKMHAGHCEKTLHRPEVREVVVSKLIEYNKSEGKRARTAELNKQYKKAEIMGAAYNGSELHKEHNKNRKTAQDSSWKENRETRSKAMRWVIPDECIEIAKGIYALEPKLSRDQFIEKFKSHAEIKILIGEANKQLGRDLAKISRTPIEEKLNELGYAGFSEFKKNAIDNAEYKNHKVSRVEILNENSDVYCMTVVGPNGEHDRHNFALKSTKTCGTMHEDGIFVLNSIDEDYFIPIRGQSNTKIDTLQGGSFVGDIEDVEYLRDKLFAALKIPASYISRAKGGDEDKATLAQKDVRFARTIQRLQRVLVAELERIGMIHLFTLGYRNEDLLNFSLSLNNPSKISELQELEHWKTKFEVATQATQGFFSKRWISENLFNLSEQDFKKIQREIFHDKQFEAAVAAIAGGGAPPEGGGGGGGGGSLPDLGGEALPGLPAPEEGAAPPAEGGEVNTPIVPPGEGGPTAGAPAKRDDRRKRDNGYRAKGSDNRSSSRKYEMNTMATPEAALGVTRRTLVPGDLTDLIRLEEGISGDDNEKKLHEASSELKMLLLNLEKKNAKQDRET